MDTSVEEMSAFEAKVISDDVALNWHNDSELKRVGTFGNAVKGEGIRGWSFRYESPVTIKTMGNHLTIEQIDVYVFSDQTTQVSFDSISFINSTGKSITNWTIDSTQAYEIALENSVIKSFYDRYDKIGTGSSLSYSQPFPNRLSWDIQFVAVEDIPYSQDLEPFTGPTARIYIDATTGQVIS